MQKLDFGILREAIGPAIAQIAQARRFTLDPDILVERDRFNDRIVIGRRMRADFLELADVVFVPVAGRHQRPGFR